MLQKLEAKPKAKAKSKMKPEGDEIEVEDDAKEVEAEDDAKEDSQDAEGPWAEYLFVVCLLIVVFFALSGECLTTPALPDSKRIKSTMAAIPQFWFE